MIMCSECSVYICSKNEVGYYWFGIFQFEGPGFPPVSLFIVVSWKLRLVLLLALPACIQNSNSCPRSVMKSTLWMIWNRICIRLQESEVKSDNFCWPMCRLLAANCGRHEILKWSGMEPSMWHAEAICHHYLIECRRVCTEKLMASFMK
jgi:hypothetical protein